MAEKKENSGLRPTVKVFNENNSPSQSPLLTPQGSEQLTESDKESRTGSPDSTVQSKHADSEAMPSSSPSPEAKTSSSALSPAEGGDSPESAFANPLENTSPNPGRTESGRDVAPKLTEPEGGYAKSPHVQTFASAKAADSGSDVSEQRSRTNSSVSHNGGTGTSSPSPYPHSPHHSSQYSGDEEREGEASGKYKLSIEEKSKDAVKMKKKKSAGTSRHVDDQNKKGTIITYDIKCIWGVG